MAIPHESGQKRKKLAVYTPPKYRKTAPTKRAVKALNQDVGTTVARTVKKRSAADVIVRANLPKSGGPVEGALGLAYSRNGPHKPARVRISKSYANPKVRKAAKQGYIGGPAKTLEHELGHELGLKHVETKATGAPHWRNLMNPVGTGTFLNPKQGRKVVASIPGAKKKPPRTSNGQPRKGRKK